MLSYPDLRKQYMNSSYRNITAKYPTVTDAALCSLSDLLVSLPSWQIKECLESQDNDYLVRLSNKSLGLEHFEVCAAIADMMQERIK